MVWLASSQRRYLPGSNTEIVRTRWSSVTDQEVAFSLFGGTTEVAYTVTAPDMASSTPSVFKGILQYRDASGPQELTLSDSSVTVSGDATTPDPSPTPVDADDGLQFDVVPAKAVKGAVVSGLQSIRLEPSPWSGPELTPLRLWSALGLMTMIPLSVKSGTSLLRKREAASSVST